MGSLGHGAPLWMWHGGWEQVPGHAGLLTGSLWLLAPLFYSRKSVDTYLLLLPGPAEIGKGRGWEPNP